MHLEVARRRKENAGLSDGSDEEEGDVSGREARRQLRESRKEMRAAAEGALAMAAAGAGAAGEGATGEGAAS